MPISARQRGCLALLCLLLGLLLVPHARAADSPHCFAESAYCVAGRLRQFYDQNDGLNAFGLPLSYQLLTLVDGREVEVQWFERARLELHPEAAPNDVQLGKLGVELAAVEQRTFLPAHGPQDGCRFFPETQENVCGVFLAYWQGRGVQLDGQAGWSDAERLALWGMPISAEQVTATADGVPYIVQWFQRARVEDYGEQGVNIAMLGRDLGVDRQPVPASTPRQGVATSVPTIPTPRPSGPVPTSTPGVLPSAPAPSSPSSNPLSTNGQDIYNCDDFTTWDKANAVYQANLPGDPNKLDNDDDGIPCENLRGAPKG